MHQEVMLFLRNSRVLLTEIGVDIPASHVLEVGSLNVNGSARDVFGDAAVYLGLDRIEGPGVDVVMDVRRYTNASAFDLVISTEAMEHDRNPPEMLGKFYELLKVGGFALITCAAPPRMPHGMMGLEALPQGEYYTNVAPEAMMAWLNGASIQGRPGSSTGVWDVISFDYDQLHGDLHVVARKLPSAYLPTRIVQHAADVLAA